jgi:hypothetical protein
MVKAKLEKSKKADLAQLVELETLFQGCG